MGQRTRETRVGKIHLEIGAVIRRVTEQGCRSGHPDRWTPDEVTEVGDPVFWLRLEGNAQPYRLYSEAEILAFLPTLLAAAIAAAQ